MSDQSNVQAILDFEKITLDELKKVISETRDDLWASRNPDDNNKWAVRYPNGRRVSSEFEATFEANARKISLFLLDKLVSVNEEVLSLTEKVAELEKKMTTMQPIPVVEVLVVETPVVEVPVIEKVENSSEVVK